VQISDLKLFKTPKWFHYTLAVLTVVLATIIRYSLNEHWAGAGLFVIFTFAVTFAAFMGGLWPGIVSTALSLASATFLFVIPNIKSNEERTVAIGLIFSQSILWVFISFICELLRRTASDQKKAMMQRDEHRERLKTIFESMSDGFYTVDDNWAITNCNTAFTQFAGREESEINGKSLWAVLPFFQNTVYGQFILAKADRISVEIDVQNPESKKWLHCRLFADKFGMTGYVQDATYRKQLEDRQLGLLADEKVARSDAERVSGLKDEFIATLSHELRTPLTSILGWSELLSSRPSLDQRMTEGLLAIEKSTLLQIKLVEELLDMSRISAGKIYLEFEFIDLVKVVQEAVQNSSPLAESRGVLLTFENQEDKALVRGDHSRLIQVFGNLLSNAVKFTPTGGHIDLTLRKVKSSVVIDIKDTGRGISPAFLPYLFDRFRQGDATTTRSQGGLGLGLSIAQKLVQLHNGSLQATSDGTDQGSTFTVKLPLSYDIHSESTIEDIPTKTSSLELSGVRVLLVEDDEATRHLLETVLRESGATVEAVETAMAALLGFPDFQPNIILSDIGLPEIDGYEFIKRIRQSSNNLGPLVPAIALTALAGHIDRDQALAAGFQAHLSKPVKRQLLLETVCRLVSAPLETPK